VALDGDRYRVPPALVASSTRRRSPREAADARRALAQAGRAPDAAAGAAAALERALARYRGDFLDGEPAATGT
jgi:hypothetical protein